MKDLFEWIEKKNFSDKKQLEKIDKKKFDELLSGFYLKNLYNFLIDV